MRVARLEERPRQHAAGLERPAHGEAEQRVERDRVGDVGNVGERDERAHGGRRRLGPAREEREVVLDRVLARIPLQRADQAAVVERQHEPDRCLAVADVQDRALTHEARGVQAWRRGGEPLAQCGVSPAQDLAVRTIDALTFGALPWEVGIVVSATLECFIGICLLANRWMRVPDRLDALLPEVDGLAGRLDEMRGELSEQLDGLRTDLSGLRSSRSPRTRLVDSGVQ